MADRHFNHKVLLWCVVYGKSIGRCRALTYWSISTNRKCCNIFTTWFSRAICDRCCDCCCVMDNVFIRISITETLIISNSHTKSLTIIWSEIIRCVNAKRGVECHRVNRECAVVSWHSCYRICQHSRTIRKQHINCTCRCSYTVTVWVN